MTTIDSGKEVRDREKIVKEIAKTSDSIRKKYRALKTGRMEEDITLEKRFKPIIEPLHKIVENTIDNSNSLVLKNTPVENVKDEILFPQRKKVERKRRKLVDDFPDMNLPGRKRISTSSDALPTTTLVQTHAEPVNTLADEDIFETEDEPLEKSIQHKLQTSEGRLSLESQLGPLGQKYIVDSLSGEKEEKRHVDTVYGVYLGSEGAMLGDKRFDVDIDDNIIINGVRYAGTPGLYELIFRRLPDDTMYTEDDLQKYKTILLATNAHKRHHVATNPLLSNRGYKYKHVIKPLMSTAYGIKTEKGIPCAMTLTENKIEYVHWDDPNELVDRLRLLEASSRAGNNAHNNEILSIIEELREVGLIIN